MLNPEGGKTGKAPRRRAASMDNSSKLLKSRMRAKQTKKQAGAAGLGAAGGPLQGEGGPGAASADSPGSSQQFPKWGVNSSSPSSRGTLDDADMWTSFRPRTSSNASTVSGRLSPIAPGQEEDDNLPEESLLGRYAASSLTPTLTETLMEELDLIDGLTLMAGPQGGASPSTAPPAAPTPLPSAATLLPRGSGFSSFAQLQPPAHAGNKPSVSQCGPGSKEPSSFSNSIFKPMPSPGALGSGHYSSHVPSSLEALLTSDSPPPSDILMTQVDPLMPAPGGVALLGLGTSVGGVGSKATQLLVGKGLEPNKVAPMALQAQMHAAAPPPPPLPQQQQQQQQRHSQMGLGMILSGLPQDPPQLSALKAQHATVPAVGSHHGGPVPSASPSILLQGMSPFAAPSCFQSAPERLPTDLDIDMFTENLDCDVDYIINSDLMDGDGMDFNFDSMMAGSQGYAGPATTQGSSHTWVPS